MRIALISPKGPLYRHRGGVFGRSLRYAPLTLTTLAALAPGELHPDIVLIDEGIEDVPLDLDTDLIGMTVMTGTARRAYELARNFRRRGIPVVLGGPHVTLMPDDAAPHADAIVTGYAEETWPQLLRDFAAGQMKPRYDQQPGLELAGLPRPRRDLLPSRRYLTTATFEATRGCCHDCDFCVVPTAWGRRPYHKPIDEVVDDIRRHGARTNLFLDLNLIADPDHAAKLFEALIPLRIKWYGLSTTLLGRMPELLALAARSGCRGLLIGFESINPETLKETDKGFNHPDAYRDLVKQLHRHRIAVQACFVFGLDADTPDVFMETARFAVEAGIDLPRFAIATPFPNTPLFKRLDAADRILTRDWDLYDGQHVVFQPAQMTIEELQRGAERAWRHCYSVRSIARRLWASPLPLHVGLLTNMGYRFYARRLNRFYTCDWPMAAEPVRRVQPA
jgi:radical SAM superfamily enzyme YgiQ (UPF0313 family)